MTDAAIRNIIAGEFRAFQQRILQQTVTKADLMSVADRVISYTATKRDQDMIRTMLAEVHAEVKNQQQVIRQHSANIGVLNQSVRTNSDHLGAVWRFVQN